MAADWVIVVDDDRNDQRMACEMLHRAGIRTSAMRSGAAALDYIRKGGIPDLILLDVNMPETDGFETLRLLREISDVLIKPRKKVVQKWQPPDSGPSKAV